MLRATGYLLDDLAALSGCEYLSDLRYIPAYQTRISLALKSLNPQEYSIQDWNDAAKYLLQQAPTFQTIPEAYTFILHILDSGCTDDTKKF